MGPEDRNADFLYIRYCKQPPGFNKGLTQLMGIYYIENNLGPVPIFHFFKSWFKKEFTGSKRNSLSIYFNVRFEQTIKNIFEKYYVPKDVFNRVVKFDRRRKNKWSEQTLNGLMCRCDVKPSFIHSQFPFNVIISSDINYNFDYI